MSFQSLSNISHIIARKCSECFNVNQPKPETSQLTQQLIQMHTLDIKSQQKNAQLSAPPNQVTIDPVQPLTKLTRLVQRKDTPYPSIGIQNSNKQEAQEQFQSIESTYNNKERQSKARRSFKLITTSSLNKPLISTHSSIHDLKNSDLPTMDWQLTPDNNDASLLQDCVQRIKQWMHKEYDLQKSHSSFKISYAIRLRIQGQCMLTLLVHKLQDYRVFYLEDSKPLTYTYQNKSRSFSANFVLSDLGASSFRTAKIMAYYRISCSTAHVSNILKIFNTRQALKIMHNFSLVSIMNKQFEWTGQFPLVQVQQIDKKLKRQTTLHVARQLGEVQFENQQGRQLIQACFSLDEGDSNWQRIIKMLVSKKGCVEIYCESTQQILSDEGSFFGMKWASMHRYLANLKLIPNS